MRGNLQQDWTWLSWPHVTTQSHPMDHTASGQASLQEKVLLCTQTNNKNLILGNGQRILPQFNSKYRLTTQTSRKLKKSKFQWNIPRFYIGLQNIDR